MTKYNVYRNALSNIYHRMDEAGLFPKDIVVIDDDFKYLCLALERLEMQDEILDIFRENVYDYYDEIDIEITDENEHFNTIKEWLNNDK